MGETVPPLSPPPDGCCVVPTISLASLTSTRSTGQAVRTTTAEACARVIVSPPWKPPSSYPVSMPLP